MMLRHFALTASTLVLAMSLPASAQGLRRPAQPAAVTALPSAAVATRPPAQADFIVALVNSEPVTNNEVQLRLRAAGEALARQGGALPTREELTQLVLERIISERAQLQAARESGVRVDDASVDDAERTVARRNGIEVDELHRQLRADGLTPERFREDLRQQLMMQRVREREVDTKVKVSDADIDQYLREQAAASATAEQRINLAQILVEVPEKATAAQLASLQTRARRVLERARAGEDFAALVREYSDAPDRLGGGQLGLRPADRYPELFVEATRAVAPGAIADLIRSDAGFHIIKVLEKQKSGLPVATLTQHHARHILLRPSTTLSEKTAKERLNDYRRQVESGKADFAALAREHSQDVSASQGGDLGWSAPGLFVPEFEEVMAALAPGEVSAPLVSRFGVHLIQLIERREVPLTERQQREVVRNMVRERKAQESYAEWVRELRGRAFVELREPPL